MRASPAWDSTVPRPQSPPIPPGGRQNRQNLARSGVTEAAAWPGTAPKRRRHRSCPLATEPRVDVEARRWPSALPGSDDLRPKPAQLGEIFQRALDHPRLGQPGPLVAVHLAGAKRARLARAPSAADPGGTRAASQPAGRTVDLHAATRRIRAVLRVRRARFDLRTPDRRGVTEGMVAPTGHARKAVNPLVLPFETLAVAA